MPSSTSADFVANIKDKEVYYFSSTMLNNDEPHYFICMKRTANDILILTVGTKQFDTIRRYIENRSLPMTTLVSIPDKLDDFESPFKKETHVNCNNYFDYTVDEFKIMFDNNDIKEKGTLPDEYYEKILIGMHDSTVITPEKKLELPKLDNETPAVTKGLYVPVQVPNQ